MTKSDRKKLLRNFVEQGNKEVYSHPIGYMWKTTKPIIVIFNKEGEVDHYREEGVEVKLSKKDAIKIDEKLMRMNR